MAHGTYALLMYCEHAGRVRVGRLGWLPLQRGYYVYVGSALGPGGLEARLGHHRRIARRPHWHIDYLRRRCKLVEVYSQASEQRLECEWAQVLGEGVAGFGASDCRCESHLFFFNERPALAEMLSARSVSIDKRHLSD
jgi:Uri superfamily endonuclease